MTKSSTATSLAELLAKAIADGQASQVERCLAEVDRIVRQDGRNSGGGVYPLRFSSLARYVHYLALSIAEGQRAGTATKLRPAWAALREEITAFTSKHVALQDYLSRIFSEHDLDHFATMSTRRTGSQDKKLYPTIVLFIVDRFEAGAKEGAEGSGRENPFLAFAIPEGERDLPARLRSFVVERLQSPTSGGTNPVKHPAINVEYTFSGENLPRLRGFMENFESPEDKGAHFICYRPRHENPAQLVKSFIAIKPPQRRGYESQMRNLQSYGFVHLYEQPDMGAQKRISLGEVLPLEDGVCFVGGQRTLRERQPLYAQPLNALKVIAVSWNAIENLEYVFGGVAMSATYQRKHLVSCVALKATSIHHSKFLSLQPVRLDQLVDDLKKDAATEAKMPGYDDRYKKDVDWVATRIATLANNDPSNWEVPPNHYAVGGKGEDRASLEGHNIDAALAQLGTENRPKFKSEKGKAFTFWTGLRFGPLISKE